LLIINVRGNGSYPVRKMFLLSGGLIKDT